MVNPGTYPLKKGLTLGQALDSAGGLTNFSTLDNIIVIQEFSQINDIGEQVTANCC